MLKVDLMWGGKSHSFSVLDMIQFHLVYVEFQRNNVIKRKIGLKAQTYIWFQFVQ